MITFVITVLLVAQASARPPTRNQAAPQPNSPEVKAEGNEAWDLGVDYNRYLQEVVQVLESDPEFRKKLETSDVEKIRDGSIAQELEFVHHNLRTKLDNVKRKEIDRLRQLAMKQFELNNGIDHNNLKIPHHIDPSKVKFEVEDLRKLIKATTNDLEEADKQRREEFKRYEMEKRFEEEERLKHIENEDERKKEQEKLKADKEAHKKHEKLPEPGHKEQLEDVWEKDDHMERDTFDPATFFAMHDLNSDGQWTDDEIKALVQKELDRAYDDGTHPDAKNLNRDLVERAEEAERMREHIVKEMDKNKDRMISKDEFLERSKTEDFETDDGWETFDEDDEPEYDEEEFHKFQAEREREIQEQLDRGILPPGYPYYGNVPPGAQPFQMPPPGHPGAVPRSIPGQPAYHPQSGQPIPQAAHPSQFQPVQNQQFGGVPQHAMPVQQQQFGGVQQQAMPVQQQQQGGVPQQAMPVQQQQQQQQGGVPQQAMPVQQRAAPVQQQAVPVQQQAAPVQQQAVPVQQQQGVPVQPQAVPVQQQQGVQPVPVNRGQNAPNSQGQQFQQPIQQQQQQQPGQQFRQPVQQQPGVPVNRV